MFYDTRTFKVNFFVGGQANLAVDSNRVKAYYFVDKAFAYASKKISQSDIDLFSRINSAEKNRDYYLAANRIFLPFVKSFFQKLSFLVRKEKRLNSAFSFESDYKSILKKYVMNPDKLIWLPEAFPIDFDDGSFLIFRDYIMYHSSQAGFSICFWLKENVLSYEISQVMYACLELDPDLEKSVDRNLLFKVSVEGGAFSETSKSYPREFYEGSNE